MKILNLYAGIGGNRKLWEGVEVTAIENNAEIAKAYSGFFPNDRVLVTDAHEYLLKHYKEFDFIWSSPPCQTHSFCNYFLKGQGIIRYPDMRLYEEIIFLQIHSKCKWVVENTKSYYKPLIIPQEVGRHYFWANYLISPMKIRYQIDTMDRQASQKAQRKAIIREAQIPELTELHGLNLQKVKLANKRQVLRNCVYPEVGKHVFECAFKIKQTLLKEVLGWEGNE